MDNNRLAFKESKLISATLFCLFFALLFSALPKWNTSVWILNMFIAIIWILRIVIAWLTMKNSKRYFSIMSYGMIFTMSFVAPQPLIRLLIMGKSGLWIMIVAFWVLLFLFTTLSKKGIFKMFKDPFESKGGKLFHIILFIFVLIIPFVLILTTQSGRTIMEQHTEFMGMGAILYILSLFGVFMMPAFLIKPEEVDSI
ncbi:MAG: hypothetical protein ACO1OT_02110 [Heyndrickxia sp.]